MRPSRNSSERPSPGWSVMPEVAGALFYERLFDVNPSFRRLFKNDMRIQGVKLMTMLAMVVYNLHEPGQVLPAIRDLGVRHVGLRRQARRLRRAAGSAALGPRTSAGGRLHACRPGGVDGLLRRTRRRDEGGGRALTTDLLPTQLPRPLPPHLRRGPRPIRSGRAWIGCTSSHGSCSNWSSRHRSAANVRLPTSAQGGKLYFGLALECWLSPRLRSFPRPTA